MAGPGQNVESGLRGLRGGKGQGRPKTTAHIRRHQAAIVVRIEGIEHRIAAEPFLPGDAAIAIEIIEQEDLLGSVGESRIPLKFTEEMGQL